MPRVLKKKTPEEIRTVSDEEGNLIKCANNGKRIILSLKLTTEKKHRRLGVLNLATKTLYIKRKRSEHLMLKLNAYGFNHKVISESKLFETVRLQDEFEEWKIPKEFILSNGTFLNFKKQGFELQTFLSLEVLQPFKKTPKF